MNDHEGHLDRETAERLLDGAAVTPAAGPVAELLARAAAPARPHELSNEDNIVLAYRAAVLAEPGHPAWRRLLTFKVIATLLAALTAGGLAFASSAGIIPTPFRDSPSTAPAVTTTPSPPGHQPATTPAPEPTAAITEEEVRGLCRAYLDKPGEERGRALQTPAFSRLVEIAGGADRVTAFCGEKVTEKDKPDRTQPPRPSKAAPQAPPAQPPLPTPARQGNLRRPVT